MADEPVKLPEHTLKRTPILLNEHTVALITLFHLRNNKLDDLWITEYVDVLRDVDHAASQFIDQLDDHWSPAFLMALRRKITATLQEHDEAHGTHFAERL